MTIEQWKAIQFGNYEDGWSSSDESKLKEEYVGKIRLNDQPTEYSPTDQPREHRSW